MDSAATDMDSMHGSLAADLAALVAAGEMSSEEAADLLSFIALPTSDLV
jgi:hypothetical protein